MKNKLFALALIAGFCFASNAVFANEDEHGATEEQQMNTEEHGGEHAADHAEHGKKMAKKGKMAKKAAPKKHKKEHGDA